MRDAFTEEIQKCQSGKVFEKLLQRLDPDPQQAASKFLKLRTKLIDFVDWQGGVSAADLADDTLARVARRLEEGIQTGDISKYALGVARFVLKEHRRSFERGSVSLESLGPSQHPVADPFLEQEQSAQAAREDVLLECLRECLGNLPEDEKYLLMGYYQYDGRPNIDMRKRLAEEFGLSQNGLRLKAHRLRRKLQSLFEKCLSSGEENVK